MGTVFWKTKWVKEDVDKGGGLTLGGHSSSRISLDCEMIPNWVKDVFKILYFE